MNRTRLMAGALPRRWRLRRARPSAPTSSRPRPGDDRLPDEGRRDEPHRRARPRPRPAGAWWKAFGSADLDQVMDQALAGNLTVAQANASLERTRQLALAAHGAQLPQVDLNGNIAGERINIQSLGFAGFPNPTLGLYSLGAQRQLRRRRVRRPEAHHRGRPRPGREPGAAGRRRLPDADRADHYRGAADRHHARRDRRRRAGGGRRPQADRPGPRGRGRGRRGAVGDGQRPLAARPGPGGDPAAARPADAGAAHAGAAGRPGPGRLDRARISTSPASPRPPRFP